MKPLEELTLAMACVLAFSLDSAMPRSPRTKAGANGVEHQTTIRDPAPASENLRLLPRETRSRPPTSVPRTAMAGKARPVPGLHRRRGRVRDRTDRRHHLQVTTTPPSTILPRHGSAAHTSLACRGVWRSCSRLGVLSRKQPIRGVRRVRGAAARESTELPALPPRLRPAFAPVSRKFLRRGRRFRPGPRGSRLDARQHLVHRFRLGRDVTHSFGVRGGAGEMSLPSRFVVHADTVVVVERTGMMHLFESVRTVLG